MRYIPSIAVSAVALGLAAPALGADLPGFNEMDKDSDGALTRSEASANPRLAEHFEKVDDDGDGKLTRAEYLAIMARRDLFFLRENLAEFLNPEGKPPLAITDQQASAGSGGAGDQASVPPAASEELVRNVQEGLKAEGIDAGPVDGIWGPRTSAGVRQFQQDQGIQANAQLNAQTLSALGVMGGSELSSQGGSAAQFQPGGSQSR